MFFPQPSPSSPRAASAPHFGRRLLLTLQAGAAAFALLLTRLALAASDDRFYDETISFGHELLNKLIIVSGMGATLGFILAGHAFSNGDIERGKRMLKGTIVGSVCIFGSVSLVKLIQAKFDIKA